MNIERGVSRYIKGTASIYFAEDHVCCDKCPLMETYSRAACKLTGKLLLDTRVVDADCPLHFTNTQFEEE